MTQQQAEAVLAFADVLLKRGRRQSAEMLLTLMETELEELEQTYRLRMELAELAGRLDPVTPDAAFHAALRGIEA